MAVLLLAILFLGVIAGYFLRKIAIEEMKELDSYLRYSLIVLLSSSIAVFAFSFGLVFFITSFILSLALLMIFKDKRYVLHAFLVLCGFLFFFAKDAVAFSAILVMYFIVQSSLERDISKSSMKLIYFLVPALISYAAIFLGGVV